MGAENKAAYIRRFEWDTQLGPPTVRWGPKIPNDDEDHEIMNDNLKRNAIVLYDLAV